MSFAPGVPGVTFGIVDWRPAWLLAALSNWLIVVPI